MFSFSVVFFELALRARAAGQGAFILRLRGVSAPRGRDHGPFIYGESEGRKMRWREVVEAQGDADYFNDKVKPQSSIFRCQIYWPLFVSAWEST